MASTCIPNCLDDTWIPVRATYVNLYKWPESDAEFVRSVSLNSRLTDDDDNHSLSKRPFTRSISTNGRLDGGGLDHPRIVDSMSCRQIYLRSYTFSRKESMPQKARKCASKIRNRVVVKKISGGAHGGVVVIRRAKEMSCAAMSVVFRRLLSCTTKVDIVG